MSKQVVVGILAHVDAGKTTLAEAMLFNAGRIRKRGRVDDGDSHLDTNAIERERGITIFSSQAVLDHGDTHVMLVDAPGHVDFSAEAERTLRALDYAILVVGANDGVQGHTETLWRLLARYDIPTFIFINKIDLENPGRDVLLAQLRQRLSEAAWMPTNCWRAAPFRRTLLRWTRRRSRSFLKRASFLSQRCRAWLPSASSFPALPARRSRTKAWTSCWMAYAR